MELSQAITIESDAEYTTIKSQKERAKSKAKTKLVVISLVVVSMLVVAGLCVGTKNFGFSDGQHELLAAEKLGKDAAGDIAFGGAVGSTLTYPFVVRLTVGWSVCTGNILSRNAILTAAHCLDNLNPNQVTVTAGDVARFGNANTRQVRTASKLTQHAQSAGLLRDVGIIEVNPPFDFTTSVNKIDLAANAPPVGTLVTAVGWGVDENLNWPNNLKSATSNIYSSANADCDADAWEICTKGGAGSTCGGDSGGPLLWQRNGVNELVGLNERSRTRCFNREGNVDIFESVPSYIAWIRDNMPARIVYTRVRSKSCKTACEEGGFKPVLTGTAPAYNNAENYACSIPAQHDKRAGANIAHGSLNTVCQYGGGGTQIQATEYDCLCTSRQGRMPLGSRLNCKTACEGVGQKPIQTGTYPTDGSPVYVCAAVNQLSGYRAGWVKASGSEALECMNGGGGLQLHQTTYKCVCTIE